jgi:hypothetical protein
MPDEEPFNPSPEERRRIEIANGVAEQMAPISAPHITAVASVISDTEGEFVGSGSFMVFAGQTFLVTAKHVVRKAKAGGDGRVAFANGDERLYQLITNPFFDDEGLDVALAPITLQRPPASTRIACPSSRIALHSGDLEDLLFVHGFPGSRSRFTAIIPGILSVTLPYITSKLIPDLPEFDPDRHFAVAFDPRYAEHSDGTSATLPLARGLSGSFVWNTRRREVGDRWQPSDARVIGVIHRWNTDVGTRCLIGTRIEHIHSIVARSWPPLNNSPSQVQ